MKRFLMPAELNKRNFYGSKRKYPLPVNL